MHSLANINLLLNLKSNKVWRITFLETEEWMLRKYLYEFLDYK